VAGSAAGLVLSAALWWAYFDITALQGEHALAQEPEATRARLARDAYSFLHFPMLVGVVVLALGLKKVLEYLGDTEHHQLADPLTGLGLYALYGGVVIYLLGHIAFKWRIAQTLSVDRLIAAVGLLALIPVAGLLPAVLALLLLTGVMVAVIAYETVHFAEHREQIRHHISTTSQH
jgi:low temperature requirement protein LtrA